MAAATLTAAEKSFEEFLAVEEAKDLLRFTTAGSVDDGKSTLIGRLLYDSRNVYDDQIESVRKASAGRNAGLIDFSLLTDGLRAEREQGITIDVAYRYFATPKRKFIIADTPGHEQYTRNMVTGASTAELAIILVDARKGLLPQSCRHTYIASLLGLPHLVIAVNKMDLVDYSENVFRQIEADFREFLARFDSIEPYFLPLSALAGDNVVTRSANMPWFEGASLIEHLETVPVGRRTEHAPFRFPVQRVVRPDLDFRGYAGQIAAGSVRAGDAVTVLPSGRTTTVKSIVTFDGDLAEAHAPQSVTLTLADEVDIARGDLIVHPEQPAEMSRFFDATLVWLNEDRLNTKKRYRLKHTSRQEWADIRTIHHRVNINTLAQEEVDSLEMNAIGVVHLETGRPLYFDPYSTNRSTGSFILVDPMTNATVAAGMILRARRQDGDGRGDQNAGPVTPAERAVRRGHTGALIYLDGRKELAHRLERRLFGHGATAVVFDTWNDVWAATLREAGLLVLIASPAHAGIRITAEQGDVPVDSLPDDDDTAVESLYRLLEETRILLPLQDWTESGGI